VVRGARKRLLAAVLLVAAYAAGIGTGSLMPSALAQARPGTRFVNVGEDGPFRVWRDTKTNQCFIVTTPYFAMLAVGPC
jgi:hypothetical protein